MADASPNKGYYVCNEDGSQNSLFNLYEVVCQNFKNKCKNVKKSLLDMENYLRV